MGAVLALRAAEVPDRGEAQEALREMAHKYLDDLIDGLENPSADAAGASWLARVSHALQKQRLSLLSLVLQAKIQETFGDLLAQQEAPCPKCLRLRPRQRRDAKVVSTLQGKLAPPDLVWVDGRLGGRFRSRWEGEGCETESSTRRSWA